MQVGQQRPWFRPLLLDEAAADVPVEAEGFPRPAAPVEGRHLMGDQRLVQRVLVQQMAELADQVGVMAKLQLAFDALDHGRPAFLVEAVPHPRHPVAADPGERLAAPEQIRLTQQRDSLIAVAVGGQRVRLPAQPPELMQIDRARLNVEFVTAVASGQPDAVANGLPE